MSAKSSSLSCTTQIALAGAITGGLALGLSLYNFFQSRKSRTIMKTGSKAVPVYFPAHIYNGVVYVSGQVALKDGKLIEGDFAAQARQAMLNVETVLKNSGSSLDKVLKANCYISDMAEYATFNEIYKSFFNPDLLPARVCVVAKQLPLGALVEIDVVATL
eukprot:c3933_g1_i2.p1 GENE.c3933_g1_i2~~c3933_g1_i2.p1  ORF type:complete len:172 (+),score=62.53 c3933_g1_i2:36-518(+)